MKSGLATLFAVMGLASSAFGQTPDLTSQYIRNSPFKTVTLSTPKSLNTIRLSIFGDRVSIRCENGNSYRDIARGFPFSKEVISEQPKHYFNEFHPISKDDKTLLFAIQKAIALPSAPNKKLGISVSLDNDIYHACLKLKPTLADQSNDLDVEAFKDPEVKNEIAQKIDVIPTLEAVAQPPAYPTVRR